MVTTPVCLEGTGEVQSQRSVQFILTHHEPVHNHSCFVLLFRHNYRSVSLKLRVEDRPTGIRSMIRQIRTKERSPVPIIFITDTCTRTIFLTDRLFTKFCTSCHRTMNH